METGLKGKVVIVAGGSSAIGRGIVLAFAKEGSKIVIADWDEPQGQKTAGKAKELGAESTLVIKTDVTHVDEVDNMVKTVLKEFGTIDVLVNNVGRPYDKLLSEETKELLDEEIATNLISTVNCMKAVLPHMIQAGKGNIVNLGSEAGRMGDPSRVIYSACKGGVIALTKAVARDVGRQGVRVNCICPNTIMPTSMDEIGEGSVYHPIKGMYGNASRTNPKYVKARETALANHAIARMGIPSDIAPAVVFLASEGASYITGQSLSVNGGNTMP
jgi:2-hydroxycyclohexanecarboxyl-CoA dehydrogenase